MSERYVLFACTLNRTRSPMAEALAAQILGPEVTVMSCGVQPCEEFDPFVFATLAETWTPLDDRPGRGFESLEEHRFDTIICLTPEAYDEARARLAPDRVHIAELWPVADPTDIEGSREQKMEAYRALRDDLTSRIKARFLTPST
ncbi:MAG: arsenate-mycothiol transferase ArsC [Caulobacteraceae bacterium]